MMLRSIAILVFALAMPAAAQTSSDMPAKSGDVVVMGKTRKELDRQAHQFLESIVPTSPSEQKMPRFDIERVCPIAIGLSQALDRAVTDRLRRVATAAFIDVDRPDCRKPSALVLFVDDIAPTIAMLEKRYIGLFIDEYGMPIHIAKRGPVVVWHLTESVNQNGEILSREENAGVLVNRMAGSASRIVDGSRQVLGTVVVLIERRSVEGLTVTQVADYAAMRAFADTRPPRTATGDTGADPPTTILSAIEAPMGSPVPVSLTTWDLGFLRGLYRVSPNLRPWVQRGEIAVAIRRDVAKPQDSAPSR